MAKRRIAGQRSHKSKERPVPLPVPLSLPPKSLPLDSVVKPKLSSDALHTGIVRALACQ